jgi:hypothetical protein
MALIKYDIKVYLHFRTFNPTQPTIVEVYCSVLVFTWISYTSKAHAHEQYLERPNRLL